MGVTEVRSRAEIPLADPVTSSHANAADTSAVSKAVGYALERLAEKYPDIDRTVARRFVELALMVGGEVPMMVLSHEAGHKRVALGYGWDADIEITGWPSGVTHWTTTGTVTNEQRLNAQAGGVNQETLTALESYRDWALAGGARYQEALGFLLAQTNLALYALRTLSLGDDAPARDDVAKYVERLDRKDVTIVTIFATALATDLLSASFWAALIGGVRFVAKGERHVKLPSLRLGNVDVVLPHFYSALTARGLVVGGTSVVKLPSGVAVSVGAAGRLDGSAIAPSVAVSGVQLGSRVKLGAKASLTVGDDRLGFLAGASADVRLSSRLSLSLGGEYKRNDLSQAITPAKNGLSANAGLIIDF